MSLAGIHLATRSLLAHERALEVTGQNIANAETPGYSRQVALTRAVTGPGGRPLDGAGAAITPGGGVDVVAVVRTHAAWLDRSAAALSAQVGQSSVAEKYSGRVEALLAEPGTGGLQHTLGQFFDAASQLASQPDSLAAREGLLRAGGQTAERLRQLTDGLEALRGEAVAGVRATVARVNELSGQIAALNGAITQAQAGGAAPNELLDQRDQLVADLTRLTGATVSGQEGGALVVSVGGRTLVQGSQAETLSVSPGDPFQIVDAGSGEALFVPGGELRGLMDWGSTTLPGLQAEVAAIRNGLAEAVNGLHRSGTGLEGSTGQDFFTTDAAGNLQVNPALQGNPYRIAAGDGTAGDGSVAQALAGLGAASGDLQKGYSALVARIGASAAESRYGARQAELSLEQVRGMQASETGVNLDEELAHMVSLQHAYAASARLLSTFDQMLDTLIQRTGA